MSGSDRKLARRLTFVAALTLGVAMSATPVIAGGACDPTLHPTPDFQLYNGDRILCFGDSVSQGASTEPGHYAVLLQALLRGTYCAMSEVEVQAKGSNSGHWRNYRSRLNRVLKNNDVDVVLIQDAGKAQKRNDGRFVGLIEDAVERARSVRPFARFIAATTPPLDVPRAGRKWARSYPKADNFQAHNDDVWTAADALGISVADWASAACSAFNARPDLAWTDDGVHPDIWGHLLLAVATARDLGVPRNHLGLAALTSVYPALTEPTISDVADLVYASDPSCAASALAGTP